MIVIKRDKSHQTVRFDAITQRIEDLVKGLDGRFIDPVSVTRKVIDGMADKMTTDQIDTLAAEIAASMVVQHPDYGILAARIAISNLHKKTTGSFFNTMKRLYTFVDPKTKSPAPLVDSEFYRIVSENAAVLDKAIQHDRDYDYDFFGFKTLEKSYLMRIDGQPVERPQHLLMRVAVGIHGEDISAALETYDLLSQKLFTHATPTLFNAGTPKPQMSSCFLLTMQEDSIDGIYDTLKQCAKISQSAGGIGLAIHNVRAKGSYIKGTGGQSNGIVPMLRNFDMTARYVDQGGGKRKGSFAIYLEPWHADIEDFLKLRLNHGKEEMRARDLFYALWIPDLFMEMVEREGEWALFCPNEAPGLSEVWGEDFENLYHKYVKEGRARKTVSARKLFEEICTAEVETGNPFILFKDAANRKSNQKNLGTIKSSNLCTEIIQYTSKEEVAVCNLASIALNKFVRPNKQGVLHYDHEELYRITKVITRNLNKVINQNYYPVPEAKTSNWKHRPIGIGVQGLADTFLLLGLPFDCEEAKQLNREIFETIYYAAMETSMQLAVLDGPYETFQGSPASKGIFQFDMWGVTPSSGRWNWDELKQKVKTHGIRNSLLIAPMPTASTSQIMGNNECFEPYTTNIYTRRTLAGEYIVVNKHLMKRLIDLGKWSPEMIERLKLSNGSIATFNDLPAEDRKLFRTVWEISQKEIMNMSADRGAYICQSQSLNIHLKDVTLGKMSSMHFHAWKLGLKTGMYYLRTQAAVDAIKFTADKSVTEKVIAEPITNHGAATIPVSATPGLFEPQKTEEKSAAEIEFELAKAACSLENPDSCEVCGS